jgi:hypothetical protein
MAGCRPGPAGHLQRLGSIGLTVTSDGSIAALDTEGLHDRANFLWLWCQHYYQGAASRAS